jgi:hypothetical protein
VFLVKRFYTPDWGEEWMSHFSVDVVNGTTGNILKFENRPVLGSYLRVGQTPEGLRRSFKLRQDFMPAEKQQWEDDITASTVVPGASLRNLPEWAARHLSLKFCSNAEARFFQRPDDAIIRGYDKQTEKDLSRPDNFLSNFEPLPREKAEEFLEMTVQFSEYTEDMKNFISAAAKDRDFEYFAAPDKPRIVNGAPSKNPRYLQLDPNYVNPRERYLADLGPRLYRKVAIEETVLHPVGAILPGRRNNPPDKKAGIRPLAVYGPIHYQELPELFMDFICSLTGKSPSTTGAGSEGALTKGPFNPLVATTDLNNALLSYILTGYSGFTTAAGYIGPKYKVEHDISLMMPELWSRLSPEERDPAFLKAGRIPEQVKDLSTKAGRYSLPIGMAHHPLFAATTWGAYSTPPRRSSPKTCSGPNCNPSPISSMESRTSPRLWSDRQSYIDDGSIEAAIPPLKALLWVMATGATKQEHPRSRASPLFDRGYVLGSDWYAQRPSAYQNGKYLILSVRWTF